MVENQDSRLNSVLSLLIHSKFETALVDTNSAQNPFEDKRFINDYHALKK